MPSQISAPSPKSRKLWRIHTSAVVDRPFGDRTGDKTAILRKYDMSTEILFWRHE